MKFDGILIKSDVEQIVGQVAHRYQLSQKDKDQLCSLVLDSLSGKVRVPEQHKEAFHDATVMLQSAGHINSVPEMPGDPVQPAGVERANPPKVDGNQEKRRFPRAEVNWPLTIKTPHGPVAAVMKDISAGGAFVCGKESFRFNEDLPMTNIHVRSTKLRLSIGAKVTRSNIYQIDNKTATLGMGVQFTGLSTEARKIISTVVSGHKKEEALNAKPDLTQPVSKNDKRLELDSEVVRFEIEPSLYPLVKLYWKSRQGDDALETDVSLPKEMWINTARACELIVYGMGTFSSKKVRDALSLMAERILSQIEAEDKRLRYKAAYEDFFDSVVEIYNSKEFDKVRKGQMIHQKASQLKLNLG